MSQEDDLLYLGSGHKSPCERKTWRENPPCVNSIMKEQRSCPAFIVTHLSASRFREGTHLLNRR